MIKIVFTGDVMLGRGVGEKIKRCGALFPFEKISSSLEGDVIFGNLESPISDKGVVLKNKKYTFFAEPETVNGLLSAGFDVFSLANNHILDYGSEAVDDTKRILESKKIKCIGIRNIGEENLEPVIIERKGIKIAFLAYTERFPSVFEGLYPGPFPFVEKNVLKDLKNARKSVDFLIVSMHWGKEYKSKPTDEQKKIGRLLIDNGADIVVGHHPHVLQPIEKYKEGLIIYSLGNFVFDQVFREEVRKSMIVRVSIDKNVEKIPIYINDDFQPSL